MALKMVGILGRGITSANLLPCSPYPAVCHMFFYLSSGIFNFYFLNVSYGYDIALILMGFGQILMWYFSRFKDRFNQMAILYVCNMYLVALPANWFFNAGSQGPTLAFIYISIIYSVVILYEIQKLNIFAIAMMIGIPVVLLLFENFYPLSISGYLNSAQRFDDLIFSNTISIATLIAMMMLYTKTLKREVRRANDYSRQLRVLSETDSLTTLKNRAYSVNALQAAEKARKSFNVIILDIDHFKHINDTYGHDVGDIVLKKVSDILKYYSHTNGVLLSRYGGEEFLMVTFFHSFEQTMHLAESVREAVSDIDFPMSESVTVSLGVAQSHDNEDYPKVIKRADEALYDSKHLGRNRVSTLEA